MPDTWSSLWYTGLYQSPALMLLQGCHRWKRGEVITAQIVYQPFPSVYKYAVISPSSAKTNLSLNFISSYCPVSLSSFIIQLLTRIIHTLSLYFLTLSFFHKSTLMRLESRPRHRISPCQGHHLSSQSPWPLLRPYLLTVCPSQQTVVSMGGRLPLSAHGYLLSPALKSCAWDTADSP